MYGTCIFILPPLMHIRYLGHVACLWHLRVRYFQAHISQNGKLKLQFLIISLICTVMWTLYVDHSSSSVGHICTMWQTYLFRST